MAVLALARAAEVSAVQLEAPFDLSFETPSLRTIELLQQGRDVYDPAVYEQPPYWITAYTPLYHLIVASLPSDGENPFWPGRLVSLACMLLAACTLLVAAGRSWSWGLLTFGAFLLVRPVVNTAAYLKNDSLALLCSALAVLAVARSASRPRLVLAAAALCALAVFAKQSFVAAAVACFLHLAFTDRRRALVFGVTTVALTGLLVASVWSPGFLFSVLEGPRTPMFWGQFSTQWIGMLQQPVFVVALVLGGIGLATQVRRRDGRGLVDTPYPAYALASTAVLLGTLAKFGSSKNYFIEPAFACLLFLAAWGGRRLAARRAARPDAHGPTGSWRVSLAGVVLGAGAFAELAVASPDVVAYTTRDGSRRTEATLRSIADTMRSHGPPEPRLLNLYATKFSYPVPGEILVSDPFTYLVLWESGRLETDPILDELRRGGFDGVVLHRDLDAAALPEPVASLVRTVEAHYRVVLERGPLVYLVPDASSP
ncbi:MAG: hypothetical protein ACYTG2_16605 [Planctomycetota bacterium]